MELQFTFFEDTQLSNEDPVIENAQLSNEDPVIENAQLSGEDPVIEYFTNIESRFLEVLVNLSKRIPLAMDLPDYRFEISQYFCEILESNFSELKSDFSVGYDMVYVPSPTKTRISVKILKTAFQTEKKRGRGLSKPKDITMKNGQGNNTTSNILFDYVLVIQRGKINKKTNMINVRFGVITKKKYETMITSVVGEQVRVKIPNSAYDFLSKNAEVKVEPSDEHTKQLNDRFYSAKKQYFNDIYKFN